LTKKGAQERLLIFIFIFFFNFSIICCLRGLGSQIYS